jgi:hypothetical protein
MNHASSLFVKFHWTAAEQRAQQNETIRTTIGNLSGVFNTSVSYENTILY